MGWCHCPGGYNYVFLDTIVSPAKIDRLSRFPLRLGMKSEIPLKHISGDRALV